VQLRQVVEVSGLVHLRDGSRMLRND
jgi:hypothetical protein